MYGVVQHVGPWYIIACPNAAEPFDSHTSSASRAPGKDGTGRGSVDAKGARGRRGRSYATEMAELAQRLVRVAGQHGVQLQVGIHTGSAAGAVLGTLRAFYCIYGDTVNISSRLCKAAEPCQIHCSAAFVRLLQLERTLSSHVSADAEHTMSVNTMSVRSRGHVLLKGLPESMETFVVLCENNGQEERESDGRLATSEEGRAVNVNAFNVDAFTGADALAAASGKQASTGGEGKAGSVRKEALLEDPYMSLLHYSHLSTESRATMLDKSIGFRLYDAALDKEHLEEYKEQATEQLNEQAISCIAYHLMGVVFQLVQVLYTVHTYDSSVLGPELAASHLTLSRLLHLHAAIQLVLSVVLVIAFRRCRVEWSQRARMLLAILRIAWLVMCIYASSTWPMAAYTVCFSALFNTSQSLIWLGSFRNMALLYCLVNVLVIMLLFSARHLITSAFISRWLCSSISTWMFVVWAEEDNRRSWRLHHVFSTEMKRLDNILNDLLPLNLDAQEHFPGTAVVLNAQPNQNPSEGSLWTRRRYSSNLLSGINTGQKREALVLQLDLCHFTQLSRSISAMHLAQALHELFSAFDTAVQHLGLFKVDTVGDAFIVAAWLPPNALSPRAARVVHSSQTMIDLERARKDAEETGQICSKILWLASTMLDAVDACRIASCPSQRVTARIGIGAGKVLPHCPCVCVCIRTCVYTCVLGAGTVLARACVCRCLFGCMRASVGDSDLCCIKWTGSPACALLLACAVSSLTRHAVSRDSRACALTRASTCRLSSGHWALSSRVCTSAATLVPPSFPPSPAPPPSHSLSSVCVFVCARVYTDTINAHSKGSRGVGSDRKAGQHTRVRHGARPYGPRFLLLLLAACWPAPRTCGCR